MSEERIDVAIIGAGAAGMTAGIFAARQAREAALRDCRVVIFDGARKPGAKILVSGGGRCNVTNENVSEKDFFGGSKNVVRNVLRQFDHRQTLTWMQEMGVTLKLEKERGKYFPVTDKARTVLDAFQNELCERSVELRASHRLAAIEKLDDGFRLQFQDRDSVFAKKLILATGGRALPKSGSDGWGLDAARKLGHEIVPTTPALVPLLVDQNSDDGKLFNQHSGVAMNLNAVVTLNSKVLYERQESVLMTHFGLSGPAILDASRHWLNGNEIQFRLQVPAIQNYQQGLNWVRQQIKDSPRKKPAAALRTWFPGDVCRDLFREDSSFAELRKDQIHSLASKLGQWNISITGSRGYPFAETTAGGVSLTSISWKTMESKVTPGLYVCGEILDVDGRLGGFNFQWAWSSGYIAGKNAIAHLF